MLTVMPSININPPMVGIFCLFICHLGPISRIFWPNFILRSQWMTGMPIAAVTANAITAASKMVFIR